jgi:hypothetical protein
MNKMDTIKLKQDHYGFIIHFICNYKGEEAVKYINRFSTYKLHPSDLPDNGGFYDGSKNKHRFILMREFSFNSVDFPLLCHEILHCTFSILNELGLRHSKDGEEAFTYYFQYLSVNILSKYCDLKKIKPVKIK